jgi:hypothetical protein
VSRKYWNLGTFNFPFEILCYNAPPPPGVPIIFVVVYTLGIYFAFEKTMFVFGEFASAYRGWTKKKWPSIKIQFLLKNISLK